MKLTKSLIRDLLNYNEDSGLFTWKERDASWFKRETSCNAWNARYSGKEAGTLSVNAAGYPRVFIRVLGKGYVASRLAFIWMGEDLPKQVDHLDRDSTNNSWINLRCSTHRENMRNKSKSKNNTSGVTGVTWNTQAGKWKARVEVGNKEHFLGYFSKEDLDLAAMEVMEFRYEHGFSVGHGQAVAGYASS